MVYLFFSKTHRHRLIKITDRTLDVERDRESAFFTPTTRNTVGLLPQGYCERTHINLEKTTYSVLSVILINLCLWVSQKKKVNQAFI